MIHAERLLKAAEIFYKEAQSIKYKGETLRGMLGKLLTAKAKAALKGASEGKYYLAVDYHLVPDSSKRKYDRKKSTAKVIIKREEYGEADGSLSGKMSKYNGLALGALIKYYEHDKLPNPLPDGHPGRRELQKEVNVASISIG